MQNGICQTQKMRSGVSTCKSLLGSHVLLMAYYMWPSALCYLNAQASWTRKT